MVPITELKYHNGKLTKKSSTYVEETINSVLDGKCLKKPELMRKLFAVPNPPENDNTRNVLGIIYDRIDKNQLLFAKLSTEHGFYRDTDEYFALPEDDVKLSQRVKTLLTVTEGSLDDIIETNSPCLGQALLIDELDSEERALEKGVPYGSV